MTKEEFANGMAFMSNIFSKDMTAEQVGAWYSFFRNDKFADFQRAVRKLAVTSKFFPSIKELKEVMAEDAVGMLTADQAWDGVLYAVRKYGAWQAEEAMKSLPAAVQLTVNHLGGFQRICMSEDLEWTRRDFMKAYDVNKNREELTYTTGTLVTIADVVERKKRLEAQAAEDPYAGMWEERTGEKVDFEAFDAAMNGGATE